MPSKNLKYEKVKQTSIDTNIRRLSHNQPSTHEGRYAQRAKEKEKHKQKPMGTEETHQTKIHEKKLNRKSRKQKKVKTYHF